MLSFGCVCNFIQVYKILLKPNPIEPFLFLIFFPIFALDEINLVVSGEFIVFGLCTN